MTKSKVLVLGSNATRIEVQGRGTGPTGNYLNETVAPAMALIEAGYHLVLATPNGTKPHIDEASDSAVHFGGDQAAYSRAKAFWANDPAVNQVSTLRSVIKEGLDGYAGVFVPGGQAPVVDLMQDPDAGEILRHFHQHSKPTALLCHGPIALVSAMPHAREFRAALIAGDEKRAKEWAKTLAQSGKPLFGIQESNAGKVVIFGGGVPVVLDETIVGAVGTSAGTVEQDIAVAEAAIAALGHQAQLSDASRPIRKASGNDSACQCGLGKS